jgi:transposase
MDHKGALEAMQRCKSSLDTVQSVLADSGYVGKPFAQGVRETLGETITVRIATRSEFHIFAVIPKRRVVERSFAWLEKTRVCRKTSSDGSTPACSLSTWPS